MRRTTTDLLEMLTDLIDRYQLTIWWTLYVGYVAGTFHLIAAVR
jgi:hypothetical protein